MALSPREEKVLASLEEALRVDDPAFAALLRSTSPVPPAVAARHVLQLLGTLLALILVTALAGPRLGVAGTVAVTAIGVVPWVVLTARSLARRPPTAPARRSRQAGARGRSTVRGIGLGPVALGVLTVLVALAALPPLGQALLGVLVTSVLVGWLGLRALRWVERRTQR